MPSTIPVSPTVLLVIAGLVVVIVLWLILRRSARQAAIDSIPHVTYVDETLLDLIRTRQLQAAAAYYQKHTGADAADAEKVVRYFIAREESLMLLVRLQAHDHAPLYSDEQMLAYLKQGRPFRAIRHYSDKTGADIQEAQIAINALAVNPAMAFKSKRKPAPLAADTDAAGIKDLIAAGDIDRAIEVYQEFMGVDEYTARAAVQAMMTS